MKVFASHCSAGYTAVLAEHITEHYICSKGISGIFFLEWWNFSCFLEWRKVKGSMWFIRGDLQANLNGYVSYEKKTWNAAWLYISSNISLKFWVQKRRYKRHFPVPLEWKQLKDIYQILFIFMYFVNFKQKTSHLTDFLHCLWRKVCHLPLIGKM